MPSKLTANTHTTRRDRYRRWVGWGLVCYWGALFVSTHVPLPPETLPGGSDKLAHFGAYLVLSAWLTFWCFLRGHVAMRHAVAAWGVVAAYAILDEMLQKPTGRTPDVWDCAADWVGAAVGIILVVVSRALFVRRGRDAT